MWYETGHVGFVIRMNGLPFDGVEDNYLYTQFVGLKNMLAGMGKTLGNRLAVWTTLQRKKINFNREYSFKTPFCQQFADKYLQRFHVENYFENVFHITVLIKSSDIDSGIKEAEELMASMMSSLTPYEPTLLAAYQNQNGILFF
ncbi:hypothetical protein QWX77_05730 [Neisseria gonorrhoeae]